MNFLSDRSRANARRLTTAEARDVDRDERLRWKDEKQARETLHAEEEGFIPRGELPYRWRDR